MDEIIKVFGINWKLIAMQAVNFGILLYILNRFLYRPLFRAMEERRVKIEKGINDAHGAVAQLALAEEESTKIIELAKKQARVIIDDAHGVAEKSAHTIVESAKQEAQKVVVDAQEKIQKEKERFLDDVEADMTGLVVTAVEKVIQKRFDSADDARFIQTVLENARA